MWGVIVLLNSIIRLTFPSVYVPATRTSNSILSHPLLARSLATVAEWVVYKALVEWYGLEDRIMLLVAMGEIVSWTHVLLQSEVLGFVEDFIWTLFHANALANCTQNHLFATWISFPFVCYMTIIHLPWVISKIQWKVCVYSGAKMGKQDFGTKVWTTLSLVLQPVVFFTIQAMV